MEPDRQALLNVPITDAERARSNNSSSRSRSRSHSPVDTASTLVAPEQSLQHARDRQYDPRIGRFGSLRHANERYDDPDQYIYSTTHNARPSLPDIYEESHYSDHEDDEPLNPPVRATTFPRTTEAAYTPVRSAPEPKAPSSRSDVPPIQHKFWQPIWLTKIFLAMMIVLLLLIIIAIVVICRSCDANDGFSIPSNADHYAWTWIPTAIMVFVVALWRQIDYHIKSLMPWKELTTGPTTPFDSILADYISSFSVLSYMTALKRIHHPVIISMTAFLIANCMTIAATGIFIVQDRTFTDTFSTNISTFDSSALNPAILTATTFPNTTVYTYTQNVENNLSLALGVASGYAYVIPTLYSSSKATPANATYNVTTNTFVPKISCQLANVTLEGEGTITTTNFPYNSTESPYGSPANLTLNINTNEANTCGKWPQLTFRGLDPLHYVVPAETLESRSVEVYCEDDADADPILLLTLIEVQYTQDLLTNVSRPEGEKLPIAVNAQRSVARMVNVICQADYSVSQVSIEVNTALVGTAAIALNNSGSHQNGTLRNFDSANMTTIYSTMLESNTGLFTPNTDPNFIRTPAFDLLAFTSGTGNYANFFDSDSLVIAAENTYVGTMPEFASKNLVASSGSSFNQSGPIASIRWSEDRLYINWTAVIILLTGLGNMVLLTAALMIFVPQNVVPRDPNTIAAAATTMTRSTELNRLLRKLQSPQNKGIAAALNGYEVGTAIAIDERFGTQSFKIHVTEGRPQRDIQDISPSLKFWNPTWLSLPVLVISVFIPLILLGLLQVTQNMSDSGQGLLAVPDDRGTLLASHYIPALVTLLVAAIINNLDFYLALFAPWSRLYKTNAPPEQSILTSVVGHFTPSAIRNAFKARYWGAFLSGLATV